MATDKNTAEHNGSEKKPYDAPKLVVMDDAAEMTQLAGGLGADGPFSSATAPS